MGLFINNLITYQIVLYHIFLLPLSYTIKITDMDPVTDFTIGRKVRWYYKGTVDKEVMIASEVIGEDPTQRVRIDHLVPEGPHKGEFLREGGYVNIDELFEI